MKMYTNFASVILIAIVVMLHFGCYKHEVNPDNETKYLIFGHYYGECGGERCVETYKLTKTRLFEDELDTYMSIGPFRFFELSNQKFELVKDLFDFVPAKLLASEEQTFGCPDCGDWGGLMIRSAENNQMKTWFIDQQKSDVPEYLHPLIDKINEKIKLINE